MNVPARRLTLDRAAGRLAPVGAVLGVLAGIVGVAVGPSIRNVVGNKLDTTTLGFATIALSAIAVAATFAWGRPGGSIGGRRLGTILALALPGAVCFTTIGQLWYPSGVLLLGASILIAATTTRTELAGAIDEPRWLRGLIVVLGCYYVFLGGDSHGSARVAGVLGAAVICAAVLAARHSARLARTLLVVGALPFAVLTWWSVVTPLAALLILAIGLPALHPNRPGAPRAEAATDKRPALPDAQPVH
ncbi:MAG: hypothetical protein ABI355_02535 [Solirubrobacteraceae bacterium]